jgi:uncharacterized membrane protein
MNKQDIFFFATIFGFIGAIMINTYTGTQPWYVQLVALVIFAVAYFFISGYCTLIHKSKTEGNYFVDCLNECKTKGYDLDTDDIQHILDGDFEYVRKANTIAVDDVKI